MKFHFRPIIFFLLCPLPAICSDSTVARKPVADIVLIFDNIPPLVKEIQLFSNLILRSPGAQVMIYDNFYLHKEDPRPLVKDTIVYHPKGEHILLSFVYSIRNKSIDYVIPAGSTVTFRFTNGLPYVTSSDHDLTAYLNYECSRLMTDSAGRKYTPYEICINPVTVAKSREDLGRRLSNKTDCYPLARNYLLSELQFLTEESGMDRKHPVMFNFLSDKLTYQAKMLDLEQNKLSPDSLRDLLLVNKTKPTGNIPYSYFIRFLETVARTNIDRTVPRLRSANGTTLDYREAYDRVNAWDEINDFYKKQLLYKYLIMIGDGFSVADFNSYLTKFSSFTNDSVLIADIKQQFPQHDMASRAGDSLVMLDTGNERLTLQNFLRQNKGKVIYIDFWASWCKPCRMEKDNAAELRKKFKDKDVVFAYFSVDKNKSQWIEAYNEDKMNEIIHNYILVNPNSSAFLKSLNFRTIPRYLVYDKSGQLVHKKAPGPGAEETHHLLAQLISQ